jgi:hypothetical protein
MGSRIFAITAAFAVTLASRGIAQGSAARASAVVAPNPVSVRSAADSRQGFWYGGGIGAGAGSMRCSVCADEEERGTAVHARLGTTVTRSLLFGVEGTGWQRGIEGGNRRLLAASGGVWWYPSPRHGYYVKGGVGVSRWRASEENEAVVSQALALNVGAGYEVRVNPVLSIVPYLNLLGSSSGALWFETWEDGVSFERQRLPASGHAVLLQLGVGLTRH